METFGYKILGFLGFPDFQGICGFPKNFLKICIFSDFQLVCAGFPK